MIISQRIFDFLRKIPKDRVVTYKFLAQKFDIHPRAVAHILRSNTQQNIYPCYKVICSDGSIGWYNLGIQQKIDKLTKDNIPIENQKIEPQYIRHP